METKKLSNTTIEVSIPVTYEHKELVERKEVLNRDLAFLIETQQRQFEVAQVSIFNTLKKIEDIDVLLAECVKLDIKSEVIAPIEELLDDKIII